jgi:hypothetical protein
MAHFAKIDADNKVTEVLVVPNEQEHRGNEYLNELGLTGTWIQTSYNGNMRGTYAGAGYSYNPEEDIFVLPKPYASWLRNGSHWEPPTPYPTDGLSYEWVDEDLNWQVIPNAGESE